MTKHTPAPALLRTFLLLCVFLVGCGRSQPVTLSQQQVVDGVRSEVAKILKKDAGQIDVAKSLVALGADELDIVEIVMSVEEAFKVKIPDSAIGGKPADVGKTLTVQKLAEIVFKQPKTK